MATNDEWAKGYCEQARVDLQATQILVRKSGVDSTCCMLFQMVFEKIAKAALIQSECVTVDEARKTHAGATKMVKAIGNQRAHLRGEGIDPTTEALSLVEELEKAHPQITADGPHLEYPWEDTTTREIKWPERHLEVVRRIGDPLTGRGAELLKLADQLVRNFKKIFP